MAIPVKPTLIASNRAPDFVELKLGAYRTAAGQTWWETRPVIKPRLQLVHTNGATKEGSIESSINWGNAAPYSNTHPHYQVDRHRAAKLVPTDRKGIGNATAISARGDKGNVSDWSIVIETADEGWPTPGDEGGFIGEQVEMVAQILAYESILWGIPLFYPKAWYSNGTATHTEPFAYPYWSLYEGKPCPGSTKKQQMRDVVLPRAREIAAAWTEEPTVVNYFKTAPDSLTIWASSDGLNATRLEEFTVKARGIDVFAVKALPAGEADKYVYQAGLTAQSVK